ncbi:hypothetical protein [Alteromonas lipotrueae]|uniref:hypothetical protein n=1 Tax=Alteromonas lipotrueae TaxID=2803814 RepID=UPI001C443448|nr:hypothetical protein [Alteromonas lipotrueae]
MKYIIVILTFLISSKTLATTGETGWRSIENFGCHLNDGTCYFTIDGQHVGNSECTNNNIRFSRKSSQNGEFWASMLLAAHMANKKISLNIEGCYGKYPTFTFGKIE